MLILRILLVLHLFMDTAKLLGNTVAQPAPNAVDGILENAAIAVPLKYQSNFWRSLEIPLINCEVELKLRWTKHCALSVLDVANDDNDDGANSNNIIFAIKDTELYVPGFTLLAKDNQKLLKLLSKGFERLVYWNE